MDNALGVAEIIEGILDFCGPATLANCARVNSVWNELALARLWRGSYDAEGRWSMPPLCPAYGLQTIPKQRLKIYLRHVRYYVLTGHDHRASFIQKLFKQRHLTAFNAEHLQFAIMDNLFDHESALRAVLVPSLRSVSIWGLLNARCLFAVMRSCPNVRFVRFGTSLESVDSGPFVFFLRNMPQVVMFEYWAPALKITGGHEDILIELLSRPNLLHLTLEHASNLTERVLERTLSRSDGEHAALSLKSLEIRTTHHSVPETSTVDALETYLPRFENLRLLQLCVGIGEGVFNEEDFDEDDFDELSSDIDFTYFHSRLCDILSNCSKLQHIELRLSRDTLLDMEDLVLLARSCTSLRNFEILAFGDEEDFPGEPISLFAETCNWKHLAEQLKAIECLRIGARLGCIMEQSDSSELFSFARNCPNLRDLAIDTYFDPVDLRDVALKYQFPRLERLSVCFSTQWRPSLPSAIRDLIVRDTAQLLCEHMPRLVQAQNHVNTYLDTSDAVYYLGELWDEIGDGLAEEDADMSEDDGEFDTRESEEHNSGPTEDYITSGFSKEDHHALLSGRYQISYRNRFLAEVNHAARKIHRRSSQMSEQYFQKELEEKLMEL